MPTIKKTRVEFEGRIEEREVIVEEEHVQTWERDAEMRLVGKPTPRVDGVARVTGKAVYTYDVQPPRMLIGRFLRSPHPHARITRIDSSKAEAMEGVVLVWHRFRPPPIAHLEGREIFPQELAYEGAEVAFVVARDERTVEDALAVIDVDYEPLPFAHDFASAADEEGPVVLLGEDNWISAPDGEVYERGNVGAGLEKADIVVELYFTTPVAAHCCLETHGSAASWEGDLVTVWHSTQSVFGTRSSVADALDLSMDKVRAISNYMGGGFGSKWGAEAFTLMAVLAARETDRPVKALLDREEEHLVAGYRPASQQRVRLGAKKNGTLTLIEQEANVATGAFGGGGPVVGGPAKDLYLCPNVRTVVRAARANTDHARAFRAPGYVEGTFALESAMDALADKLGMDPLDLRLKNYAEDSPSREEPYSYKGLRRAYEIGAERFGWSMRQPDQDESDDPWRRGYGMASQIWGGGGGPPANAICKLLPDGTAEILVGVQDIGTGTKTALTQVAAEELGLPLDAILCVVGDSLPAPYGPGSGGSVTLASSTPAVRSACREALRQLIALAAIMLELPDADPDDFVVEDGDLVYSAAPAKRLPFTQVAAKMGNYTIVAKGARGPNPEDKAVNTFGAHFAQVAVNVETGQVRVERVVAVHDIGRVINPLTATSQVYGGVTMGMGFALTEERVIDPDTGLQLTANLEEYKVPVMMDIPEIDVAFVDVADTDANSVGSKGLGEPPIIPIAAAIANAIFDAVGVRVTDLPVTPDRLLALLPKD